MKNRVEQLRKEMGLSQEEFARALRYRGDRQLHREWEI